MDYKRLLDISVEAAINAGKATLNYWGTGVDVQKKSDSSPLTQADLESNRIIDLALKKTDIPILSEENTNADYTIRKEWDTLWIVDPLDGTKEFIKGRNEYTINIALIKSGGAVLGVIYVPVQKELYFGTKEMGAFKVENVDTGDTLSALVERGRRLTGANKSGEVVVVASLNHRNSDTDELIDNIRQKADNVKLESYGSSLKLCKVAEGEADIYPRLAPTMEWDTAAGQAIVELSGCKVVQYPSFEPVIYNKEDLLNPYFIVYNPHCEKLLR